MDFYSVAFLLGLLSALLFYFLHRKNKYWEARGVPFVKPVLLWGNMKGMGSSAASSTMLKELHHQLKGKGPVGGIYFFTEPAVLITDLDLLRNILVKDFQYFQDRGMYVNERDDPLSAHLFSLSGDHWKVLRAKLSPTFTSGRMKMMFPTMSAVANQFADHLKDLSGEKRTQLEMKELLSQFTTDVIGNVAFGIECNTMKDPDSEFRRVGRKTVEADAFAIFKSFFLIMFPKVSKFLRLALTDGEVTKFFLKLLGETVKYREEHQVKRDDFMSLLLQLKNTGKLEGEEMEVGKLTFNELAAQVFLFFVAGFETSSSAMTFALYELALNPDIQERAREEVLEVLQRQGGTMTYEAAMELKYVDQIINETLRKYPVVDALARTTTMDYKVPNTDIILEKGTLVIISALGFQSDPEIYPQPEKFDPERFTKENIAARHPFAFLPFGLGPRICIGMRFGMMQSRLGLAAILSNFRISPSEKTPIPLVISPESQFMAPLGGMNLNLEQIVI